MAEMCGVANRSVWSRYESGHLELPTFKMLTICAEMKVSMDYFYRGSLMGVHPDLVLMLAEREPELVRTTNRIRAGMGMDPIYRAVIV